jgi:3D (Asp-Asp-Asp) domain-containing protein
MLNIRLLILAALCCTFASCGRAPIKQNNSLTSAVTATKSGVIRGVKTTAYTHSERDHLAYGAKAATGAKLKYGEVRSAAADWSVYPVGTVFKIEGDPHTYEVDDYGSALVGTGTIDIYKPSKAEMRSYGARHVNINVVKWGSFLESLAIMKPREGKKPHIHQMIYKIERSGAVSS